MIVLVGGPWDGRELDAPEPLQHAYRIPRPVMTPLLEEPENPIVSLEIDEYVLGVVEGYPSRDDRGRVRYLYARSEKS